MLRVGQRLKEERLRKELTLDDVSKSIKIKTSFLSAIEQGEYRKLPSSAYAQGFVRNYAEFLNISEKEILPLFRREFNEKEVFKVLPEGLTKTNDFPINKLRLQQTFVLIVLIFIVLSGYILFQYRYAIINPPLEIDSPKENSVISKKTITVSGQTDSNSTLFVNNDSVSVNRDGKFEKKVDLFPGKSTIKIKAVNRFGRQTEVERHVEVKQD